MDINNLFDRIVAIDYQKKMTMRLYEALRDKISEELFKTVSIDNIRDFPEEEDDLDVSIFLRTPDAVRNLTILPDDEFVAISIISKNSDKQRGLKFIRPTDNYTEEMIIDEFLKSA
jgi:hypothetical protein